MEVKEPVTEDYRSDRLLLEELVAEVRRIHRRLDELEPYMPILHRWMAMKKTLGGWASGRGL